jgi:hypothetical protein
LRERIQGCFFQCFCLLLFVAANLRDRIREHDFGIMSVELGGGMVLVPEI